MNKKVKILLFYMSCAFNLQASNFNAGDGTLYVIPVQENQLLFRQADSSGKLELPSETLCEGESFDNIANRVLLNFNLQPAVFYQIMENENDIFYVSEIPLLFSYMCCIQEKLPENIISYSKEELSASSEEIKGVNKALIFTVYDQYQRDKKAKKLKPGDLNFRLYPEKL